MEYVSFRPSTPKAQRQAAAKEVGPPRGRLGMAQIGTLANVSQPVSQGARQKAPIDQLDNEDFSRLATLAGQSGQSDSFHERAAIAEFEGRLPRAHAEVLAALQEIDLGPNSAEIFNTVAKKLEYLALSVEMS